MPLQRRVPKRGFTNIFKTRYSVVNVGDLERFGTDTPVVGPQQFIQTGLLKGSRDGIKLLGDGLVSHAFTVQVHKASAAAVNKIEAAGGRVELIPLHKRN